MLAETPSLRSGPNTEGRLFKPLMDVGGNGTARTGRPQRGYVRKG